MAETEVTRDLKEINRVVKQLNNDIDALSKSNKKLDKSLKLDPSNVTLLTNKASNLAKAIETSTKKVNELKRAQEATRKAITQGKATEDEYKRLEIQIAETEAQAKSFRQELQRINNAKFDKAIGNMQKLSRVATGVLTSIVALEVAYAAAGDAISKASDKYNISAEAFQRQTHIFEKTTSDTDSYLKALEEMTSKLAQVEKGSTKTIKAFEALGFSTEQLSGLSSAEALDILIDKLSQIEDVDQRAIMANQLLSSSGTNVALIAGLTAENIAELNAQLEDAGILTQEEADNAAYISDRMADVKNQVTKLVAELGDALVPAMEALLGIAKMVLSALGALGSMFNALGSFGQGLFVVILAIVTVLPKLVSCIKAVNAAMYLLNANPIAAKIILIVSVVALLILGLIQLAKWLSTVFGKKYKVDADTSSFLDTVNSINMTPSTASAVTDIEGRYAEANSASGTTTIDNKTTNYYDYSTVNVEAHNIDDIDSIAEQLSMKIQIGG